MRTDLLKINPLHAIALFCTIMVVGCTSSQSASRPSVSEEYAQISAREPIVLVCDIDAIVADEELSCLGKSLAPVIRRDLFCIQNISVVPTEHTMVPVKTFFINENGLKRLAQAHGADIIIIGMLTGDSKNISIQIRAYDLTTDDYVFKSEVAGKTSDVFTLQRKLVYGMADSLGIHLSKEDRRRIKACSPKNYEAAVEYGRGLKYEKKERYNEALIAYHKAHDMDACLTVSYVAEARIFARYNTPMKAMASLDSAVEEDEFFAEAWYQLNRYAAQYEENIDAAIEYCRKALEIAPRFGKARLMLGVHYYSTGDLIRAIEETKKAAMLLPADPAPRYNLGSCYRDAGDYGEARKWYGQALTIDPEFDRARTELEKLKGK